MTTPTDSVQCDNDAAADVKLFNAISLRHILRPFSENRYGVYGHRYRTIGLAVVWIITAIYGMQLVRLYLTLDDFKLFPYVLMMIVIGLNGAFKGFVLVSNADRLCATMTAVRPEYTSCGRRDSSHLQRCRKSLAVWLHTITVSMLVTLATWVIVPWVVEEYVPFVKLDGTVGHYRLSVYNFWIPVSESTYNWMPVWSLIYWTEVFVGSSTVFFLLVLDWYSVTMCVGLNAQFRSLSSAYEKLGNIHQCPPSTSSSGMYTVYVNSVTIV